MKYVPFSFSSKDGLLLQGRAWVSQNINTNGSIFLVHDLGEHSARYAHVGEEFANKGFHFIGFDLRGHGLSEGDQGHASKFTDLINDIEQLICQSKKRFGFSVDKRILYGQGLGGNLVLNYVLRRKPHISGAIITSPLLNTHLTRTKLQVSWLNFLANFLPKLKFHNHINSKDLTRDLAYVKAYQKDVYNHNKISASLALETYRNGKYALANADSLDIPLLVMHGISDRISPPSVSKSLAEKVGNMAEIVLWENAYHELQNDNEKKLVLQTMIDWLNKEIKS
jgi:alpha-beta hydrolase superfamily lysophospholipase